MQQQIEVSISQLKIDPANVRKTDTAPTEQFVASIREQGVLEPLTVRPNGNGYLVTNGGKRLAALAVLVKDKTLAADTVVPCIIRELDEKDARNISLAVNYMREGMHPCDEYEAFAGLLADGMSAESIGRKYGLTKRQVGQVLALGNLAPEIRAAWRDEKIEEDAAQAFTLEPDQKKQAALFASLRKNHGLNEWTVKKHIIGEDQKKSGMIAFVGIEAYTKAGGTTTTDLFSDKKDAEVIATDLQLIKKLYDQKLKDKLTKLEKEGWKWAAFASDMGQNAQWWDAKGKSAVKAEDRGKYGAMIVIDYHGAVEIKYGVVKPTEKAAADKKKATAAGKPAEAGISAALAGRLSQQITRSAATVLMTDSHLALAAIAAALTCHEGPICIDRRDGTSGLDDDDNGKVELLYFDSQLAMFRKMSGPHLEKVLARLAATSLNMGGHVQHALPLADELTEDRALLDALDAKKLNAQLRANFDAADYFTGLTAQVCKDAIALCDPKQPITGKEKKSELATLAADLVKKSNAGGKAGWLPPEMRTKAYDGPKAKAATPAKTKKAAKKKAK